MMNKEAFHQMKKTAIFLNLGRGPIVVEEDLAEALEQGEIAAPGRTDESGKSAAQNQRQ